MSRVWPIRPAGQREDHVAKDGRGEGSGEELWLCGLHEQEGCRASAQEPERYKAALPSKIKSCQTFVPPSRYINLHICRHRKDDNEL